MNKNYGELAENYWNWTDNMKTIHFDTKQKYSISSLEVSQMINKEHKLLMRDIRRYVNQIEKINNESITGNKIAPVDFFQETSYIDAKGETRPCYNVTRKGCEFVANKLTGIKGTEFTARYVNKFHELEEGNIANSLIASITTLSETMIEMQKTINDRLTKLEETTKQPTKSLPIPKYSRWKSNTFDKFKLLMNYVNKNSDQDLSLANTMNLVFKEVQDTYNVDFADYTYMYKCEFGLPKEDKVQTLDVINHYKDLKYMFNLTLDTILDKLHIQTEKNTSWNIFDELAAKIN